jgi:amino acid transporter
VCFAGAGSAQTYHEEVRRPSRTIPRAEYASIAALGLIYLLTVTSLLIGREPSRHELDHSAVTPVPISALLMIASFAMVLALHNLVARYLYSLGRDGVFSTKLGAAHPELGSPYRASFYLTVLELSAVLVIGITTDLEADGEAAHLIFLSATGLGAIGIVALLTLVSLAALAYFIRNRRATRLKGRWHAVILPIIALAGTASILALSWGHAQDLIGAGGVVSAIIPIIVPLVFAAGWAYASKLGRRRPEVFARIGRR